MAQFFRGGVDFGHGKSYPQNRRDNTHAGQRFGGAAYLVRGNHVLIGHHLYVRGHELVQLGGVACRKQHPQSVAYEQANGLVFGNGGVALEKRA